MINLLPPEEKEKLFLKSREKLSTILGITALVFLICLILVLLSIKFYILADTDYQKTILQQTKQAYQTPEVTNLNNTIKKYNGILSQLNSFYGAELYFSRSLETITGVAAPDGLYLANFSLVRDEGGGIRVAVSGTSSTRDDLLIFKKNVEDNKSIASPYFSPESWINQQNTNFSLTFEFKGNEEQQ